jgi:hypothetical protein
MGGEDWNVAYRINWHISPPYVARARQMPSLRRGLIAKGGLYTKCTRCMNTCLVIKYFVIKYVYSSSVLTPRIIQ